MSGVAPGAATVFVGGVGELYQGDLDLGRLFVERMGEEPLPSGVLVEDLSYGAVAVAQRLQDLQPRTLVLVGAVARGREPGTVERRVVADLPTDAATVQHAVTDAVTGYVSIDILLIVASGLGHLPEETIVVEVEPESIEPAAELTVAALVGLSGAVDLVRAELQARFSG